MSSVAEAGRERTQQCEKHKLSYPQMRFADELWVGQCTECAEDQRLEQEALAIFAKRQNEFSRQVLQSYKPDEERIAKEAQAMMERDQQAAVDAIDAREPEYRAYVAQQFVEAKRDSVKEEMLAAIIKELRENKL